MTDRYSRAVAGIASDSDSDIAQAGTEDCQNSNFPDVEAPCMGEEEGPCTDQSRLLDATASNSSHGVHAVSASYGSIQGINGRHSSAYGKEAEEDELRLLQSQVFLEDAAKYRSIDHKVDLSTLRLYQLYHSLPFALLRYFVIFLLHILAFFEFPSSLTWTSDIRHRGDRVIMPCGVTESIELLCLMFLLVDVFIKSRIYGYQHLRINRWLSVEILVLGLSFIDWMVSVCIGCTEVVRVRRMFRPIFIIQNSSLMKKILNSLRKTVPQIAGVLLLMALHLYIFTLFGMLLFPKLSDSTTVKPGQGVSRYTIGNNSKPGGTDEVEYFRTLTKSFMSLLVLLTTANNPDVTLPAYSQNRLYAVFFVIFLIIGLYCFMNMLTAIIYNQFRGYFLSSMQSSLLRRRLGLRAAFESLKKKSMQMSNNTTIDDTSGSIESSGKVSVRDLKLIISRAKISEHLKVTLIQTIAEGYTQEQMLTWNKFLALLHMMEKVTEVKEKPRIRWFSQHSRLVTMQKIICHKYFSFFGNFMALVNVALISIQLTTRYLFDWELGRASFLLKQIELTTQYDKSMSSSQSALRIINFLFILYYFVEQTLILVCMGWRRYIYSTSNVFDGIIVAVLMISEVITVALYGFPFLSGKEVHTSFTLWNFVRVINILIMFRLLRVIWHIKTMAIVAHTLLDLIKNLQSFGGIIVVIYYFFAILGMELFRDVIVYEPDIVNSTTYKGLNTCGTYEQLGYWANNFDDFGAALVVLWDVMVVNNWFIFLDAYAKYTTSWSNLYFISWWLISVVLALNLFTALILENFIMKWDRYHDTSQNNVGRGRVGSNSNSLSFNTLTVHDMFRPSLKEPTEEEIMDHLGRLKFFKVQQS